MKLLVCKLVFVTAPLILASSVGNPAESSQSCQDGSCEDVQSDTDSLLALKLQVKQHDNAIADEAEEDNAIADEKDEQHDAFVESIADETDEDGDALAESTADEADEDDDTLAESTADEADEEDDAPAEFDADEAGEDDYAFAESADEADAALTRDCADETSRRRNRRAPTCEKWKNMYGRNYCNYAKSARRRNWAAETKQTCQKTCGLCTPAAAPTPTPTPQPTPATPPPTTPVAAPTITAKEACNAYYGSGANGRTDCVLMSCGSIYDGKGYVAPSGYNCGESFLFRTDGVCGPQWEQAVQYRYKDGAFRKCSNDAAFDPQATVRCDKAPFRICDSTPDKPKRVKSNMCSGPAKACSAASCCVAAAVCSSVTCPDPKKQFKRSDQYKCSSTSCRVGECCMAAAKCDQFTYNMATKSSTTCTGDTPLHKIGHDCNGASWSTCDVATCCEADHTCDTFSCAGDASISVGSDVKCGRARKSSMYYAFCDAMTCCKAPSCTTFTGTMTKPARYGKPAKPISNLQAIKRNDNSFLFYAVDDSAVVVQEVDGSGKAKGATSFFFTKDCPSQMKNDAHACILAKCKPTCPYPSSIIGGNWPLSDVKACQ